MLVCEYVAVPAQPLLAALTRGVYWAFFAGGSVALSQLDEGTYNNLLPSRNGAEARAALLLGSFVYIPACQQADGSSLMLALLLLLASLACGGSEGNIALSVCVLRDGRWAPGTNSR